LNAQSGLGNGLRVDIKDDVLVLHRHFNHSALSRKALYVTNGQDVLVFKERQDLGKRVLTATIDKNQVTFRRLVDVFYTGNFNDRLLGGLTVQ